MNKSRLFFVVAVLLALTSHFAESKLQSPPRFVQTPPPAGVGYGVATDEPTDRLAKKAQRLFHLIARTFNRQTGRSVEGPFEDA